jgi:two-component system cell cycle response regulator
VIVDDSPGDARLVAEMLRSRNPALQLSTFERVDDATRAIAITGADCVLLDIGLPDANELDGLERILTAAPGMPVVMLTGRDDNSLALAAVRLGAQDYVTKRELDETILWRAIERAIERAWLGRELRHQALHDSLTGLPRRALFHERLAHAIARSARHGTGFAVVFMDIDGFKPINDHFGHAVGDEILREISDRLQRELRAADAACRYGGDEFAALCEDTTGPIGAARVASRIHEAISRRPVIAGGRPLSVGVSIGVTLGSGDHTAAGLLQRADEAMYHAKATGARYIVSDGDAAKVSLTQLG